VHGYDTLVPVTQTKKKETPQSNVATWAP